MLLSFKVDTVDLLTAYDLYCSEISRYARGPPRLEIMIHIASALYIAFLFPAISRRVGGGGELGSVK